MIPRYRSERRRALQVRATRRKSLALVFGGRSLEHQVSVVSARSIAGALRHDRYDVTLMAIDRRGRWADPETARRVLEASGDRTDRVVDFEGADRLDRRLLDGSIDVAFPALHGPYGEDGTIQGLFEMLDIPYVGCDHAASAVCMDKSISKRLLVHAGLPTAPWHTVIRSDWTCDAEEVRSRCLALGLPLFVKPARLGSSVGVSKVAGAEDLGPALEAAFAHDELAIVERGLDAREIEVAVLGNAEPRASVPGEIVPGHEFYDYADKYLDDRCRLLAPAPLDAGTTARVQQMTVAAYRALGCAGMARVDLFLERGDGTLWVNEANTIPGFTAISMYPRLWGLSGLPYPDLLDELIRLAFERHEAKKGLGVRG
jgi:D-alanine-D-alanine ligase